MSPEDLVALNEQIAAMARAGLPLDRGLSGLAQEMGRGRLRSVTEGLAADLRDGFTLPQALNRRRGQVPEYYAALVTAGVRSARLPEVLATLTGYARTVAATRTLVIDALFYPTIVVLFGYAMFAVFLFGVVPRFAEIMTDFGLQLPMATQAVFALAYHSEVVLGLPAALAFALFLTWLSLRFSPRARRTWALAVYAVPLIGTLIRAARLSAFAELMAVLVEHETPLPEAFKLAGAASADPLIAGQSAVIAESLAHGEPVGTALRGRGLVPEWVAWMTGMGEQRGTLGASLRQVAAVYRRLAEARATVLRTVLPPFLIVGTASVLASVFVFALMLPLVKLMEGLVR